MAGLARNKVLCFKLENRKDFVCAHPNVDGPWSVPTATEYV